MKPKYSQESHHVHPQTQRLETQSCTFASSPLSIQLSTQEETAEEIHQGTEASPTQPCYTDRGFTFKYKGTSACGTFRCWYGRKRQKCERHFRKISMLWSAWKVTIKLISIHNNTLIVLRPTLDQWSTVLYARTFI